MRRAHRPAVRIRATDDAVAVTVEPVAGLARAFSAGRKAERPRVGLADHAAVAAGDQDAMLGRFVRDVMATTWRWRDRYIEVGPIRAIPLPRVIHVARRSTAARQDDR